MEDSLCCYSNRIYERDNEVTVEEILLMCREIFTQQLLDKIRLDNDNSEAGETQRPVFCVLD